MVVSIPLLHVSQGLYGELFYEGRSWEIAFTRALFSIASLHQHRNVPHATPVTAVPLD